MVDTEIDSTFLVLCVRGKDEAAACNVLRRAENVGIEAGEAVLTTGHYCPVNSVQAKAQHAIFDSSPTHGLSPSTFPMKA